MFYQSDFLFENDYRFIENPKLDEQLLKRCDEVISRKPDPSNYRIGSVLFLIVVDEEKIGYSTSRIHLIHDYCEKNGCHSSIDEELITPIYFKYCKTIGDVLKSFKTCQTDNFILYDSYSEFINYNRVSGNNVYTRTIAFISDLESINIYPTSEDIIFSIHPRDGSKKRAYWAMQRGIKADQRIIIDMSDYEYPRLFRPSKTIVEYFKDIINFSKKLLTCSNEDDLHKIY